VHSNSILASTLNENNLLPLYLIVSPRVMTVAKPNLNVIFAFSLCPNSSHFKMKDIANLEQIDGLSIEFLRVCCNVSE